LEKRIRNWTDQKFIGDVFLDFEFKTGVRERNKQREKQRERASERKGEREKKQKQRKKEERMK